MTAEQTSGGGAAPPIDPAANVGGSRTLGSGALQATSGTDARLSNARTPTAHAASHAPGGSDALAVDAAAATGSLRTLGTGAAQAASGTDSRLSDSRTPIAHAASHAPGGSDALAVDAIAATGSLRTLGSGATQAAGGTDARLSDTRTPTDATVTDAKITAGGLSPAKITGTAVITSDSRLSDKRTPVDGTVLNGGLLWNGTGWVNAKIAQANIAAGAITDSEINAAAAIALSKIAGTAVATGDARLSDSRAPNGPASGDLAGTYPGPTLAAAGPGATGPLGSGTVVPVVTIDAKGRVTALTSVSIAIPESAVTSLVSDLALKAPIASPTLTGVPAGPTAAVDTNTTQFATTAFVLAQATSAVPLVGSATAPGAGSSTRYARGDHAHPRYGWDTPADYGLLAWSDPMTCMSSTFILATAGTLYLVRMHIPIQISVTNLLLVLSTAGGTLTANQCFAGIWDATTRAQIAITADQSVVWVGAAAVKTAALAGGPFTIGPGDVLVGGYFNGTTGPTFRTTGSGSSTLNGPVLTGNTSRFATSSTGQTTTPPATAAALTAAACTFWAGLS